MAALVKGYHVMPRFVQAAGDSVPGAGVRGKPVHEEEGVALARPFADRELQAADGHQAPVGR
jgi:hypothetical protein